MLLEGEKSLPENSEASELVVALETGLKWRSEPAATNYKTSRIWSFAANSVYKAQNGYISLTLIGR